MNNKMEKYKQIRNFSRELNHKILDSIVEKNYMMSAGRLLGLVSNDTFVFNDENDMNVMMDFILHEFEIKENKNYIKIYFEKEKYNNIEREILKSYLNSYTSLFEIVDNNSDTASVILKDIFKKKNKIELIDFGLSSTGRKKLLLYLRVIPIDSYYITSGISFLFPENKKDIILLRYRKELKKLKKIPEKNLEFISFYRLYKSFGLDVQFK